MPAKSKKSTKKASGSSPWLSSFGSENDLLDSLLEVLKEHDITCEEIVVGLSERDIADLELSVGHRVLLRRVIAVLTSDELDAVSGNTTLEQDKPVPTTVPFKSKCTEKSSKAWPRSKFNLPFFRVYREVFMSFQRF